MSKLTLKNLQEPLLEFRFGERLAYPRDGLLLFGPVDGKIQPRPIHYGVIGTVRSLQHFGNWAQSVSHLIDVPLPGPRSKSFESHHVPFPGFSEAFHASWTSTPAYTISDIDEQELSRVLHIGNRHEAIKAAVSMFVDRLVTEINRIEDPPAFWFVVLPEFVYELGLPKSTVAKAEREKGEILTTKQQAQELEVQPSLFGVAEEEAKVYQYATNFRRQLKARLLDHRIVTQIVRETTLAPGAFLKADGKTPKRRVEDPATIAWKLCTGAYYKAGGRPWQLADVRPGVCYVGLVYKKTSLTKEDRQACCAAQMFLSNGDGVVFRGALGPWYQPDSKQYHLSEEAAHNLATTVLNEYRRNEGKDPSELFIHAKSAFTDEEWQGFAKACSGRTNVVGVQIADAWDGMKLFRPGSYPVIRGTAVVTGERSAFLWTAGFVPRLDTYMGPETPNPILVRVRRGDAKLGTVLGDVLALTKINFNSCLFNDRLPVTIRFADAIGDILVAAPVVTEPRLPFKFYI